MSLEMDMDGLIVAMKELLMSAPLDQDQSKYIEHCNYILRLLNDLKNGCSLHADQFDYLQGVQLPVIINFMAQHQKNIPIYIPERRLTL